MNRIKNEVVATTASIIINQIPFQHPRFMISSDVDEGFHDFEIMMNNVDSEKLGQVISKLSMMQPDCLIELVADMTVAILYDCNECIDPICDYINQHRDELSNIWDRLSTGEFSSQLNIDEITV